ncbi:DUF6777 domain-containing protein [Streptomyces sp. NPDC050658]|uniref:DUF6777 domain-containing protein n=1 Tax=unclassified Streptomyces TaxID=2593676 RepID=UPI00343F7484
MSVEPPSSGRPTGPPSGPLSGPTQPGATRPGASTPPPGDRPSGPPSGPPGGPPSGGGSRGGGPGGDSGEGPGGKPERPWWRSAPRVAAIAAVVVAAVVLTVVLTRPDGTSDTAGEVLLQPAGKAGPDPFTESTARKDSDGPSPSPTALPGQSASANVTRGVDGSAPGLYGGTRNVASCDVEKQVAALRKDPAKNKAFASVQDIDPSAVPAYLRSLTPVQLRIDTRVTNHGYRDGAPTAYQAVLQAGTAVLVDDRGVPRVRCACGNPLLPPVAQQGTPKRTGEAWPGYRASNVVVVAPSVQVVNVFVMFDPRSGDWFERDKGDTGAGDEPTAPPTDEPTPTASVSLSPPPSEGESDSPAPCVSAPADGSPSPQTSPGGSASPCPSTSPPSSAPATEASSAEPQPPSSEPEQPPASDAPVPESAPVTDGGS